MNASDKNAVDVSASGASSDGETSDPLDGVTISLMALLTAVTPLLIVCRLLYSSPPPTWLLLARKLGHD